MQPSLLPTEGDKEFHEATKHATKEDQQVNNKPTQGLNLQIANAKKTRDK
jgi:hypothetical protein